MDHAPTRRTTVLISNKITATFLATVIAGSLLGCAATRPDAPSTHAAGPLSPSPVASVVMDPPTPSATPRASRAARSRTTSAPYRSHLTVRPQRSPQAVKKAAAGNVRDITMYCDTGNRTASGKWPQPGMVATISRSIPFGTKVYIEGLGTYVVEDRIGHGSEFDIFTHSCAEANRFGRQHRRVVVG